MFSQKLPFFWRKKVVHASSQDPMSGNKNKSWLSTDLSSQQVKPLTTQKILLYGGKQTLAEI